MNLKNQLRLYLEHRKISASALARASGVPKQSISDWLAGSSPRNISQLKKIADSLSVSIDHLVFGKGIEALTAQLPSQVLIQDSNDWSGGLYEVRFRRIRARS